MVCPPWCHCKPTLPEGLASLSFVWRSSHMLSGLLWSLSSPQEDLHTSLPASSCSVIGYRCTVTEIDRQCWEREKKAYPCTHPSMLPCVFHSHNLLPGASEKQTVSEQPLLPLKRAGYPATVSVSPCDWYLAFMRVLLDFPPFFPGSFILCLPEWLQPPEPHGER